VLIEIIPVRLGVDVATVAAWQGHSDGGALVLKTYGDEVHLDHSLKMAALLDPTKPEKMTDDNVKDS